MPSDNHDLNSTRTDNLPTTSIDSLGDAVATGEANTYGGTLAQTGVPSWVQSAGSLSGSASSSPASRSGKAVHELEREIESNQTADGQDLADGYHLIRKLGTGSFGTVWEAEDRLTRERVAIKFFTAGDYDWEKLLSEVGLLQAVEGCRGIVMVKQVRSGGNGQRPLYVMQLANAGSLADWIKTASKLPPRERVQQAVEFFTRVARAMAAVHRRGIHHCDLKPQNILLHRLEEGKLPEPLVADFGQAHLATDDTPALGTFFYMPPDQIDAALAGTPPDTRWDVYALGAVMYEMLTGEPPRKSAELLEKIKKAPKQLVTKMSLYREGVMTAPRPVAHNAHVDRTLAKIIDRCLSLNPSSRPRDAGALVAMLDSRERWRQLRPVLALAAAASLIAVALIGGIGVKVAHIETQNQEEYVTSEVESCLARTAGYGARAVEDRLQRHVRSIETRAEDCYKKYPKVVAALKRASALPRGATVDGSVMNAEEQQAVNSWLSELQNARRIGNRRVPTLGLMMVSQPDANGNSRGFYIARVHPNGDVEDPDHSSKKDFFTKDFSNRDYFHAQGDREDELDLPHRVIEKSQISQPFRSRGVDQNEGGDGGDIANPWKLNIAAPVWDDPDPKKRTRVIGLIILGLNIKLDLASLVYPPLEIDEANEHHPIANEVKVVLIDDRNRWAWHPDCKTGVLSKGDVAVSDKLPHNYRDLAIDRRLDPDVALPWLRFSPGQIYRTTQNYVDLVESRIYHQGNAGDDEKEIACFTRFNPYGLSDYEKDAPGSRQWVFVAQVDKKLALAPLRKLEQRLVTIGASAGGALLLLAAACWVWLFRVLRRLEFASHG